MTSNQIGQHALNRVIRAMIKNKLTPQVILSPDGTATILPVFENENNNDELSKWLTSKQGKNAA